MKEVISNPRITVSLLGSGYAAVHYVDVTDKHGTYTDVQQTGVGRYGTYKEALVEARMWAEAEGYPLISTSNDIDYLRSK